MAEMIPVGNTGTPPNVGQTLSNLSSIYGIQQQQLGLQQQRQALQTGQYLQQTEQAGAQQAQQLMSERQMLQSKVQSGDFGDPNSDDYASKLATWAQGNLPLSGREVAQSALKTQSDKTSLRSSVADLQQKYRAGLGGIVSGFIGGQAQPGAVHNAIDEYVRQNPDALEAGHWAENLLDHADKVQDPQTKDHLLATLASELKGEPQQRPGMIDTGPTYQPIAESTYGLGATAQGPPITKNLAPSERVPYRAAVAGAQAGAATRATGTGNTDIDRQNQISESIQPSKAAIGLTQQIDGLADIVHSGKIPGELSKVAAAWGVKDATSARQLLIKDLGQLKTTATLHAPSIDAGKTILSGYPDETTDTPVIHAAMDYIRGAFKQNLARGELLQTYRKHRPDLTGLAGADDALTSRLDPRMTEFMSLKTPEERTGFYKRNFTTKEEAAAFKAQLSGGASGP